MFAHYHISQENQKYKCMCKCAWTTCGIVASQTQGQNLLHLVMKHTHTRLTALFPGLPGWAGTRKVKPIWILLKQEWQWHQLGHMQVCTSLETDNHASTSPLSFLQAGCPSCRPTNSVKALKAKFATRKQISNIWSTDFIQKLDGY